jgi:large subunit ribosomal protein L3
MRTIYGQKLGMTGIFTKDGDLIPVTAVKLYKNTVVSLKTKEKDGYEAVQLGFGDIKEKNLTKPLRKHFSKNNLTFNKHLREFKPEKGKEYKIGDENKISEFEEGKKVDISGISKGKGTQGNIKRHGHSRGPMSHGSKHKRLAGALAGASYPGRVFKGNNGPGRMGRESITVQGLPIVKILEERNVVLIKGALPGIPGGVLKITAAIKGGEEKFDLLEPRMDITMLQEEIKVPLSKEKIVIKEEKTKAKDNLKEEKAIAENPEIKDSPKEGKSTEGKPEIKNKLKEEEVASKDDSKKETEKEKPVDEKETAKENKPADKKETTEEKNTVGKDPKTKENPKNKNENLKKESEDK